MFIFHRKAIIQWQKLKKQSNALTHLELVSGVYFGEDNRTKEMLSRISRNQNKDLTAVLKTYRTTRGHQHSSNLKPITIPPKLTSMFKRRREYGDTKRLKKHVKFTSSTRLHADRKSVLVRQRSPTAIAKYKESKAKWQSLNSPLLLEHEFAINDVPTNRSSIASTTGRQSTHKKQHRRSTISHKKEFLD